MIQFEAAHCTTSQDMVSLSSSSQFSTDRHLFADGGLRLLTDDELHLLIRNKLDEFRPSSPKESDLRDPQYEDISDCEDKSKLPYEDVSDDENQCIQESAELSEPTTRNSRTGLDEVQIKNQFPETETRCCRSPLIQTKGDENETNISCSVLKDKKELDNQQHDGDDDEENDWNVMPITILNLNFENTDDGECGGKTSSSFITARLGRPTPNPVPASAFSQMEVFDTPAQQELAVKCGQVSFVVPSSSINLQGTSNFLGSREELCSEAEDSCETDDSLDYSSGSECNYLTVSNQVVGNLSSSLINNVSSDSEGKNQGKLTKNLQKSSNVIVCIDSDDETNSENSGTCTSNKAEPLKSHCKNVVVPSALDPATAQLQVGHTETTNLGQGTAKGLCAKNKQTNSDDDVIIILSDSDDDDIVELVEAMTPSLISVNSEVWVKEHTADKDILQDLKQSSAESSEPSWDKPGSSGLIPPGENSFHEPSREIKDLTRKRMPSSETEEVIVDDDLNNAVNGLCTKKKKVSEASGSLGPVIPRLFVQVSPHSDEQVQLVHESTVQSRETDFLFSNSSTVGSHSDSFRKKSQYSRDETGKLTSKFKGPKKVHSTPESNVDRSSFEPKIPASSLKGHLPYRRHSSSRPHFPLRSSSSLSGTTQSMEKTNNARRKVFSDWKKNHVPLRRERKARGTNYCRQSL